MSLYNGPARGGNRGGKDQFSWENVKNDKDREFYLGHSVKAATGRWQKGKDILWYTRGKTGDAEAQRDAELAAIKAREEELMAEAMGLKPKSRPAAKPKLDASEMAELMRKARGEDEEATAAAGEPHPIAADRVPGLGFHAGDETMMPGVGGAAHEVLAGTGVPAGGSGAVESLPPPPPPPKLSSRELAKVEALERKAAKRARKAEKKAKQLAKEVRKKEKKAVKRKDAAPNNGQSRSGGSPSRRSPSPLLCNHRKRHRADD